VNAQGWLASEAGFGLSVLLREAEINRPIVNEVA
jgi:hypothetical protein